MVQPDVIVILAENLHKITRRGVIGSPDLAVEIASPSTKSYDRLVKWNAYTRAGVQEYWIVEPLENTVEVLVLEDETYKSLGVFSGEQTLPLRIVPDFPIQVKQFFA